MDQKAISTTDRSQIEGLSKNSDDLDLLYAKYGTRARGACHWRSSDLAGCQGYRGQPQPTAACGQLDFDLAYDPISHFQVHLAGVTWPMRITTDIRFTITA